MIPHILQVGQVSRILSSGLDRLSLTGFISDPTTSIKSFKTVYHGQPTVNRTRTFPSLTWTRRNTH